MFAPKLLAKWHDNSSEEHSENSKTGRDTYLLLELLVFVEIFEYLVI
jgi:hypothetical protein